MLPLKSKLVCSVMIEENTAIHFTELNGSAVAYDVTLTPGLYYVLPRADTDPRSLTAMIEANSVAVNAGLSVIQWDLDDDTGVLTLTSTVAGQSEVSFSTGTGGDALELQAYLRLDGAGTGVRFDSGSPRVGYRAVAGLFYPVHYVLEDRQGWEDQGAVLVPDTGNPQGISVARREDEMIGLQAEGFPRSDDENYGEYHDLVSFLEEIASYRPFRVYWDLENVDTAYEPGNRRGFQTYMRKHTRDQRPQSLVPDYYLYNSIEIQAWLYDESLIVE